MTDFNLCYWLKHPPYLLLSLISALFSIYLLLVWRVGDLTHLGMSGLFMLVTLTLLWENHFHYRYRHERTASLLAMVLIGWLGWQVPYIVSEHQVQLWLFPFVAALAIALLASGFQGLSQYRRELAIMFCLTIPGLMMHWVDISLFTASAVTTLLRWAGFEATREDMFVTLPVGTLQVHNGFAGLKTIAYLIGVAVICSALYPVARLKQIAAVCGAALIGFLVNLFRVAIIATQMGVEDQEVLSFWYEGNGSLLFGVIAVVLFAGFYRALFWLERQQHLNQLNH
jgi:cyanoexosortase A